MADGRTMTTRRGQRIYTELTNAEALGLVRGLPNGFVVSLLERYDARRPLSEDQWAWIHHHAMAERDRRAQDGPEPADRATEHVFPAVYAHLAAARDGGLKTPGMRLLNAAGDGPGVRLKMMGERSRHRGRVMVADPRGAGDDRLYGFIDADGSFRARGATPQGVLMSLTLVNDDPAGEAARYGQQTGNCCYCDIELTTPESRAAGYGPDCAAHRGLPWGKKRQPVPAVAPEPEPVADPYAGLSVADQVAAGLIEGPTYRDFPGEERAFDPEAQDETDRDDGSFWEELETLRAGGYF